MLGMKKEWKKDATPLTLTDLAINRFVIRDIIKAFPAHGIITEESKSIHGQGELTWVCDPVDGTTPFSHGIPTSVFSLALVQNGKPILGVVYDPFMQRMYTAVKGKGATLNGKRMKVSNKKSLENTVIGFGTMRLWKVKHNRDIATIFQTLMQAKAKVLNLGSVIYQGMMVAAGESGGIMGGHDSCWDAASLKIIVEEAGGKVTDIDGKEQRYDQSLKGVIVSNKHLHPTLVKILQNARIRLR